MSSKKIISIVGPTGVGKTTFALWAASLLPNDMETSGVDLISADSRQIYQGMEVISGVDIPKQFARQDDGEVPYYEYEHMRLYGLSMIKPDQEWSVAHFQEFARRQIESSLAQNRLPIIVGGTGLYHDQLFNDDETLQIPPNEELRAELEPLDVTELQQRLNMLKSERFEAMNNSDRFNPRRLIRAIEVVVAQTQLKPLIEPKKAFAFLSAWKNLTVGLRDEPSRILEKIEGRVFERFTTGAQPEVTELMSRYPDWTKPAFSATGVQEVRAYLEEKITAQESMEHWTLSEFQYAKRQLTWWKKRDGIVWYEAIEPDWKSEAYQEIIDFLRS